MLDEALTRALWYVQPESTWNPQYGILCVSCGGTAELRKLPIGMGAVVQTTPIEETVEEDPLTPRYKVKTYSWPVGDKFLNIRTTQLKDITQQGIDIYDYGYPGGRAENTVLANESVADNPVLPIYVAPNYTRYTYGETDWTGKQTSWKWEEYLEAATHWLKGKYFLALVNSEEQCVMLRTIFKSKTFLETEPFINRNHDGGRNYLTTFLIQL